MPEYDALDELIVKTLQNMEGVLKTCILSREDLAIVRRIEKEAEERSLMGLGKVVNTGVNVILDCDRVYVAMTGMDFEWGSSPHLLLRKGEEIVGEAVTDETAIKELTGRQDVWFLHRNFVVYKDRIQFPNDIMKKICHFEIPPRNADWCRLPEDDYPSLSVWYATPCTPADTYLKEICFSGMDERGQGTILVGLKLN